MTIFSIQNIGIAVFTVCCSLSIVIVDVMKVKEITFHAPSMVLYTEAVKMLLTLYGLYFHRQDSDILRACTESPLSIMKLAIPAFLYVVQNNLSYIAILETSAPTFQLWSNLKLITTAIFMKLILDHKLKYIPSGSLLQILLALSITNICRHGLVKYEFGIIYIILLSTVSGFSSTYTEFLIKSKKASFIVTTLHIYIFTTIISIPLYKYQPLNDPYLITMMILNVFVGMSISVIMKYSNNIIKLFSTFISFILSAFLSFMFADFRFTPSFFVSSVLVCITIFLQYNLLKDVQIYDSLEKTTLLEEK